MTEKHKNFLDFYYRLLPVNDSDCSMNKICHYIEDVDFNIKQKVRSSFGFDYTLLQTEGFSPNRKIYEKIYETVEAHVKKWNDEKKEIKDKRKQEEGFDKLAAYVALKDDLENISSNDEIITNHLITLFYEDKPSYNKNVLWDIYRKTIFNILKNKTHVAYFPQKNPNGSLTFLDEKYSIEKVTIKTSEELANNLNNSNTDNSESNNENVIYLEEKLELFDNIREEVTYDD